MMTRRVYNKHIYRLLARVAIIRDRLHADIKLCLNSSEGDLLSIKHSDTELRYVLSFEIRLNGEGVFPSEQFNLAHKYIDELLKQEENQ